MAKFSILKEIFSHRKADGSTDDQFVAAVARVIEHEQDVFKNFTINVVKTDNLPSTSDIPKEDQNKTTKWLKIEGVICCFADMVNSTQLSSSVHDKSTAQIYRYFTGTIIKIFKSFDCPYIDVKGDGVFALFDDGNEHAALAAMVSVKTFVESVLKKDVSSKRSVDVSGHYGISKGTLLVRRIGTKKRGDDDQGRNEVWAGKAVNQAAKLASLASVGNILVSKKFHSKLKAEGALLSCGCNSGIPSTSKENLWTEIDLSEHEFLKIKTGFELKSTWCETHGAKTCRELLEEDSY